MSDLKASLMSKLKDPRKGLEEVEKTIEWVDKLHDKPRIESQVMQSSG